MSGFESHASLFDGYVLGNAPLKRLATGFDWVEGPVWFGDADCLLFSDIPNNRILRWNAETGISTYRAASNFSNGHTRDRQGRLISCEHLTRRVTRTEPDGTVSVLADRFDGKRLNSPNDVVVKSDGSVWFTDPHYGISMDYEGSKAEQELPCCVYRIDPETAELRVMVDDMNCPNGLAFSADETLLYVADTGRFRQADPQHMRVYQVRDTGPLTGRDFCKVDVGVSDGFRLDEHGNIWTSAGDGVHCIAPDGRLLGKVLVPETVSNVCFGGRARHVLYITATTSLYSVALNVRGLKTV
ncbi:SMP-30/gluconolactonase/LRE family protein [Jannaschia pohangensis]|uniref:Gluconolactonase n=1 Tax=Jannaschia pohangensis TaxID=390807 RepID=A0A1I3RCV2_9RHOB|nr:SMP-30/gluconolactonase/LRE family protein [Jannaschia pohangensis]SFJ43147.1 gluconolactonase [Jannaschia pohangensis]